MRSSTATMAIARKAKTVTARTLLSKLTVRRDATKGYKRTKFKLWVTKRGGCDTRAVVLMAESRVRTTRNRYCTIKRGLWKSPYDNVTVRRASKLDIDHRVPLAEAWRSGANRWKARTRTAYANDTAYPQTLIAVTAHSNRSKSDRDPNRWMPAKHRCAYVKRWVAVKYRWHLAVNVAEHRALTRLISHCGTKHTRIVRPHRAKIGALRAAHKHKSHKHKHGSHKKGSHGTKPGSGTDKRYRTCTNAKAHHAHTPYYRGNDPEYNWYRDSDSDGVVCE